MLFTHFSTFKQPKRRIKNCDQQSDRFLKLTPSLQDSLVTRGSWPVVVVSKVCVASWSGWFRTALFRAFRLSVTLTCCGKWFDTPQTMIFAIIIPKHFALRRLLLPDCWPPSNKTLTLFSVNFAFRILLCVWISMIFQEMKIEEKESKSTNISMQQTTNG